MSVLKTLGLVGVFGLGLATAASVFSQEASLKDLRVRQVMASPTVAGAQAGGVVATIENKGSAPDRLIAATSPVAERVEIHVMKMENNVMRMREVGPVEIKAGQTVTMGSSHPEGLHLMLMGLKQPLKDGEKVAMTLEFEKSGKVQVEASVTPQARGGKGMGGHMSGHKH